MPEMALPINPEIATTGRLKDALFSFVAMYGIPDFPAQNIYHANQNRMSLPADLEEYATIYILSPIRHGTPVETLIPGEGNAPDKLAITSLFEYMVQIDFYSSGNAARERALVLANIARSSIGPQFFQQFGVSLLYADDPSDLTFVGDAQQYVQRWMITLRVTMPETTTVELPGFDVVAINRLENVDVHHPPLEG